MLNEHDIADMRQPAAAQIHYKDQLARNDSIIGGPTLTREFDPSGKSQHEPGAKLDAGKIMPWLCVTGFAHALNAVADVTTKGARKYTPNGWASVDNGSTRYMEAFSRHMLNLATGEQIDKDTGCLHKAQMIWNLLASLELELREELKWNKNEQTGLVGTTKTDR